MADNSCQIIPNDQSVELIRRVNKSQKSYSGSPKKKSLANLRESLNSNGSIANNQAVSYVSTK
jgi:hypothetical protein